MTMSEGSVQWIVSVVHVAVRPQGMRKAVSGSTSQ